MSDAPAPTQDEPDRFVTWKQAAYGICSFVVVLALFAGFLLSKAEASGIRQDSELLQLRREIADRLKNIESILMQPAKRGGR